MRNQCRKKRFILVLVLLIAIIILVYCVWNKGQINNSYKAPYIPTGFKSVNENNAEWSWENNVCINWNEGLVIEDEKNGNQFVWVPVDNINVKVDDIHIYENEQIFLEENIKKQIENYGGFYISRYEAGLPEDISQNTTIFSKETNDIGGIPVSKKEEIPWNYIAADLAELNAKKMYNNEEVYTELIPESCWNMTMQWLKSHGYDVNQNSADFGNYSNTYFEFTGYFSQDHGKTYEFGNNIMKKKNNIILSTGATSRNMALNIYDIAGNLQEYVKMENGICSYGGNYDNPSFYFANSRQGINQANDLMGFRIVLLKY